MKLVKWILIAVLALPFAAAAQAPPPEQDVLFIVGPGQGQQVVHETPQMRSTGRAPQAVREPDLGKWWKNSEIVKELQLSEAQITQIEQTFLDHRLKLIDLRADVERQEAKLQPLIEADQPDEAKVSAQLDLLLAARGKLEKANAMMMLFIRKTLTIEQWKKLEAIKERRMHMHMQMQMRGPMPPGQGMWQDESGQRHPLPPKAPQPPRPPDDKL